MQGDADLADFSTKKYLTSFVHLHGDKGILMTHKAVIQANASLLYHKWKIKKTPHPSKQLNMMSK